MKYIILQIMNRAQKHSGMFVINIFGTENYPDPAIYKHKYRRHCFSDDLGIHRHEIRIPKLCIFLDSNLKKVFERLGIGHCERKLLYSIGSGREKCLIRDALNC